MVWVVFFIISPHFKYDLYRPADYDFIMVPDNDALATAKRKCLAVGLDNRRYLLSGLAVKLLSAVARPGRWPELGISHLFATFAQTPLRTSSGGNG